MGSWDLGGNRGGVLGRGVLMEGESWTLTEEETQLAMMLIGPRLLEKKSFF